MAKSVRIFIALMDDAGKITQVADEIYPLPFGPTVRVNVNDEWSLNLNTVPVLGFEPKLDVDA